MPAHLPLSFNIPSLCNCPSLCPSVSFSLIIILAIHIFIYIYRRSYLKFSSYRCPFRPCVVFFSFPGHWNNTRYIYICVCLTDSMSACLPFVSISVFFVTNPPSVYLSPFLSLPSVLFIFSFYLQAASFCIFYFLSLPNLLSVLCFYLSVPVYLFPFYYDCLFPSLSILILKLLY